MTAGNSRTPFLDFQSFVAEQGEVIVKPEHVGAARSPFVSVYEFAEGEGSADDPTREAYSEIVNELYDEEFDEALFELMTEARALHQEHLQSGATHADAERLLTQHFSQLNHESEAMID